ncbi:MAG TPA: preprotein translocase subunit YajC [Kiritimatiellia bacterium]|nr:preprotein translocase subunit YajC [Kiritimatiellia bacterium]HRZ11836.1 preprotein translocase subunit YajC [Kiritimatiellia bacterium]HSA17358.1 preprotein translocase subunit YajC [Kiritimatiellia bacterium]
MNFLMTWLAMAPAPGGTGGQQQSPAFMIGWLGLMLVIFYFMLIRPQQRREKERRALLTQIKSGDRVVFCGGLLGIVTNAKEKTFTIKVDEGVKLEVVRSAVTQVLEKGETPEDSPAKK